MIFGLQKPRQYNFEYPIDVAAANYIEYNKQKASEPKTSLVAATLPPSLAGIIIGALAGKGKPIFALLGGAAGIAAGLIAKDIDDSKIDHARLLQRIPNTDLAKLNTIQVKEDLLDQSEDDDEIF